MTPAPWGRTHQQEYWTGLVKVLIWTAVICVLVIAVLQTVTGHG